MASLVHQRVSKAFDDKVLEGVIVKYFKGYEKAYHISYDDGESEDVSENEARRIL
jgi:hypothetical protein